MTTQDKNCSIRILQFDILDKRQGVFTCRPEQGVTLPGMTVRRFPTSTHGALAMLYGTSEAGLYWQLNA